MSGTRRCDLRRMTLLETAALSCLRLVESHGETVVFINPQYKKIQFTVVHYSRVNNAIPDMAY